MDATERLHTSGFWFTNLEAANDEIACARAALSAAEQRTEKAETERARIEREWEVLATKDLDCEFDRMKRKEAEQRAAALEAELTKEHGDAPRGYTKHELSAALTWLEQHLPDGVRLVAQALSEVRHD